MIGPRPGYYDGRMLDFLRFVRGRLAESSVRARR
jgi:hypothetical protein